MNDFWLRIIRVNNIFLQRIPRKLSEEILIKCGYYICKMHRWIPCTVHLQSSLHACRCQMTHWPISSIIQHAPYHQNLANPLHLSARLSVYRVSSFMNLPWCRSTWSHKALVSDYLALSGGDIVDRHTTVTSCMNAMMGNASYFSPNVCYRISANQFQSNTHIDYFMKKYENFFRPILRQSAFTVHLYICG